MPFITRYSTITNGAMTFTGNTLGLSQLINVNQAGTQGSIGAFVTLSGTQVPTFPIGTTLDYLDNSSEAILNIPPGSTILYAELIWGGNYLSGSQDISGLINDSITFTTPLGSNIIAPDPATANQPTFVVVTTTIGFYMRSAEVTGLVQAAGSGTYSAGGVPGLLDPAFASTFDSNNAGWTLAVVYGNPSLPARDMNLFVGAEIIQGSTSVDIPVSGFVTPALGAVAGRILLSAQEGDANIAGDQTLFGPTVGSLGILSGPNNPATNFYGSQINNDSGNLDTTGTFGDRNQDPFTLTNIVAGRQGWDITNVDATPYLINNQTDAVLRLNTSGDAYMPNTIGIQIDVSAPNLQPVKSVDKDFAAVGDTLTYTVVIPNNSLVDANNVIFTDIEPPDTAFVPGSFTLNGVPVLGADPNLGVNIGTVPTGGSATVTFQVIIQALPIPNPIVNQAVLNYEYQSSVGGPILSGSANTNQVTTQVNSAELTMVKSVDQAFATIGDTLTYTTVITNTGDVLASNVFFEDIPPAGSLFVPNSVTVNAVAQPGVDPGVGFNIGDLAAGATVTVTFQVIVNSLPVPAQLINTATATFQYQIDPGQPPVTETASSNPVTTQVNVAAVSVVKSVDQATAITGDILTYTTVITNNGNIPLLNVIFTDTPPAGSSFVPGSVTVNGVPQLLLNPSPPGFSIGDIPSGAAVTVTFQVLVTVVPVPPTLPELINTSTIDYQYEIDPNLPPLNGTMTSNPVITEIILGELGVVKSVDQAFATVGDTLTYTSVITNQGNVEASDIFFLDAPPLGTAFVPGSVTINGVPQAGLDPALGFSIPAGPPNDVLAPSGVVTVTFQVTISSLPVPPLLTNQSLVNYRFGESPIIVTAPSNPVTTQVNVSAVNVLKSVDQATAITGDTLTYTTVITNNGNIPLQNVIFTDTPPAGTSFVSGSVTVNGVSQPLVNPTPPGFSVGDIAVGATVTVVFQVLVTVVPVPPALPVLTNTSTIDYQYQIDPNLPPLNGTMTSNPVVTEVILGELGIVKSVDQGFATVGDTLTYTSVITNQGNVEANNIFFFDAPPAGTAFVPGSVTINGVPQAGLDPTLGFSIPAAPPNDVLPPGGAVTVGFQVTISALPVPPQVTNNSLVEYQFGESPVIVTAVSNPATTQVNVTLLNMVKSVDKVTAITGEILTYTTVISNTGNVPLLNVLFTDTPPAGTSFVSGSVTVNGVSQPLANPIPPGFSVGDIPAGGTATITFQALVTVVPVPPAIPVLTNTSTIDYQYQIDPNLPPLNGTLTSNPVVTEVLLGELTVVKSVDQAFATVGDTLTYTSVITNQGNVEASDIFFLDAPPLGTAFVPGSVTINGVPQAGLNPALGFSIPAGPPNDVLAPGGVVTVTFQVTISSLPVPSLLTNQSLVNYRFGESPIIVTAPSNPVTTQVNVSAVNVLKSVDQATAITGDILTYTTVITNNGNIPLQNVIFTDTPPAGTSFVPGSVTVNGVAQPLANPTPPGFSVGDIAVGATVTVVFQVLVTVVPVPPALPVLTNTSTIDYQYQIDPNLPPLNGTMTSNPVVTEVILGELRIVKSVDQGFATVGDTLTYTSVITNQGNVEANNIFFLDAPPAGTAFVPGSVTINGVPQAGLDPTLGFSIPAAPPNDVLPPGGAVTVVFQVTISALPVPPQVTNNSLVEYQFGEPPVIVTAVSNPATTQVNVTLLNMVKSVDKVTAITGEILTYTTVISNTGNVPLLNVLFTDTPPAGTSFVSGSVTVNGVSQPLANPIPPGFSVGDIPAGGTATITFQALVTVVPVPPAIPVLTNTSTIDYQYQIDPNLPPLNGTLTSNPVVTEVLLGELTVVKSVDQGFATVGDTLTYTSVITNQGNVEASDIFFLDAPPLGTAFVPGSVTINGVPQAGLDPALGFSVPAGPPNDVLTPGGVVTVAFQVTISSLPVPPLLTNNSLVNYQFGESPIIVTVLSNPVTTQVNTASVSVVKSVDQITAITGDILTYTTVISNTGNIPLLNVIFTDTPPVGTSFVPGSVTVNGIPQLLANPTPPGFIIGNIPAGATTTVIFQVTVTVVPTPPVFPVLTNTSTIDYQYQIDPNLPPLNGSTTSNLVATLVTEGIVGELEIVKSVDQAFATVGDTLTYTTVITNQGNVEASNIFFFDVPPLGTNFLPGTVTINGVPQPGLNPAAGFSIPASPPNDVLPPGGVVTIAFQVTIAVLPVPPQITNNSLVEYQFGDPPVIVAAVSNPATTQINQASVNLIKSVDQATAITGDSLTYTNTITNTGDVPLLNVIFTDTPPTGTSFVPGSVTVNGVSQPLANPIPPGFSVGDIAVGATVTVVFQVLVTVVPVPPTLPVLSNTSTIDYQYQIDPNLPPLNGTATSNPAITEVIVGELGVVKSVDQAFAAVGDTLTYSVVVTNQGNVEASNIFFQDVPAAGAVFIPGTVTINGVPQAGLNPTLGFSIPAAPPNDILPPGGVVTVTFQVTIAALPVPPQIRNNALVEYQFGEPPVIVTAVSNTVTTQVNAASVNVVKSVDKLSAITGDTLTYTTVISNTGNVPLLNVIFTDTPPVGTGFVSGSVTVNGVSQPLANPTPPGFSIGDIPVGGAVTVIFRVTVTVMPVPPLLPVLTNTSTIDYQYQIDPNLPPLNGTATSNSVLTRVILGELGIVKSVDQTFATVGDTLTYTSVITNQGNVQASNIFFLDAPPAGTAFIPGTVTINGVPQAGLNPTLGFSIPAIPPNDVLPPGGVVTVAFQATISALPVPPQITNNSLINYQFGTPPVIVSAASNPVTTQVNVALVNLVKSVDQATAITGDTLTYTTVISNTGNVPLLNVIFTDTPPAGTSFVPGSVTVNGVPQLLANPIPPGFIIGNLPAGATATVTFQALVTVVPVPPTLPVLSNTSTIDYQYQIDPNLPPLNGTATSNPAITEVIVGELGVVKSVDQAFAAVGDTLTYSVVVTNQGNVEASNIFFQDVPAAGAVFIPGTVTINGVPQAGLNPTLGFSIPAAPPNDILPPGGVVTVTFQVTIAALPVPPQIRNNALVEYQFGEPPVIVTAVSNTVTTQVNAASVNVVKSVDKLSAITGDTLTYTTVISNTGNVPLLNVIFTDTPPVGTGFVSGSVTVNGVSQPLANPTPPGFSIGDIPVGGAVTVIFRVTVTVMPVPPLLPVLTNTSTIDYQYQIDPNLPPLNGTATSNSVLTRVILGELGIVKSVDQTFATVGDTLTYTSVITNQGNVQASNIFFLDAPPAGTAFIPGTVTINGVPQAGLNPTLGFSIPAIPPNDVLPPGGVVTVAFQATISALPVPPQITNNSLINYQFGTPPVIVSAASNPVTTQVNVALVNLVKSVDQATAITGDTLTYTTVISNTGNVPLLNVIFTDTPPAGTSFVPGSVTVNGVPQLLANPIPPGFIIGNLPAGATATVTFQALVTVVPVPPTLPVLSNTSTIDYQYQIDPNLPPLNGTATSNPAITEVIVGELRIVKSVDQAFATLGDTLTYTSVITNQGNVEAGNIFFLDVPTAGAVFIPGTVMINGVPQPGLNPTLGFSIPASPPNDVLPPGGVVTITFQVMIAALPVPPQIRNNALIDYQFGEPPVIVSAVSNTVTTQVNAASVNVVKSVDKLTAITGDILTYTTVISNTGNIPLLNVIFTDTPPVGTSFVPGSVTVNGVSQPLANPLPPGFSIGNIPAGAMTTVTFQVLVTVVPVPPVLPVLTNTSTIDYQYQLDPNLPPLNGTATSNSTATEVMLGELGVVKSVDKAAAPVGDTLTYTSVITNQGNVEAGNIFFMDAPPVGTVFSPGTVTINGVPSPGLNPTVGFSIPAGPPNDVLPPSGVVTVTFQVTIATLPVPPQVTNNSSLNYQFGEPPIIVTVTSNPVTTQVNPGELTIVESVDKAFAAVGDTLTYTSVITNQGNVPASNVFFQDVPPASTAFIPGTVTINGVPQAGLNPATGFSIPASPPNDVIPPGGVVTVAYQATIATLPVPPLITNDALVNYQFGEPPISATAVSNPVTTQVNEALVSALKSVDKATVTTGDILTYTTVMSNNGNVPLLNVIFTDTPPVGTSFVPGSVTLNGLPQPLANPLPPGFSIGNIAVGAIATVTFQVLVTAVPVPPIFPVLSNTSTIDYQYRIDPNLPPLNGTMTSNPVTTEVVPGELSISESVDKAFAAVGDTLTYTSVITNQGAILARSVFFRDLPPAGTVFIPGTVTINGAPQPALNPTAGFSIPEGPPNDEIPPGGVVTVIFQVRLAVLPVPPQLINHATVSFRIGDSPVVVSADSNLVETQVILGELRVAKSVDEASATLGDILTYTVVITNTGNVTSNDVFFTDLPPAGTDFVPGSVTIGGVAQPSLNPATGFNLGSILPGSSVTVSFEVQIASGLAPFIIINQARVTFNYRIDPSGPPVQGSATSNSVQTNVNEVMESVCIVVQKVYFSCQQRECFPIFTVELPSTGGPFTFVSIEFGNGVIVGSPVFTPIPSRPNFSRAQFTVRIPYVLVLKNALNESVQLSGDLPDIQKDIVVYLPPSRSELELSLLVETRTQLLTNPTFSESNVELAIGSFIITKITGIVQLLIPAFGFCPEPSACEEFVPDDHNSCLIFTDPTLTPFPNDFFPPQLDTTSCMR